jgi:hypothetical protein
MGDLKRAKWLAPAKAGVSKRKGLEALSRRVEWLEEDWRRFLAPGGEFMEFRQLRDELRGFGDLNARLDESGLLTRALSGQVEVLRSAVAALRREVEGLALGQRRTELEAELGKAPRPAPEPQKRRRVPPVNKPPLKPWEKAGVGRHSWYRRRRLEREAAAQALVAASVESDGESDP